LEKPDEETLKEFENSEIGEHNSDDEEFFEEEENSMCF